MGYGRERLKDIAEKEAEEVKGQQQEEEVPAKELKSNNKMLNMIRFQK